MMNNSVLTGHLGDYQSRVSTHSSYFVVYGAPDRSPPHQRYWILAKASHGFSSMKKVRVILDLIGWNWDSLQRAAVVLPLMGGPLGPPGVCSNVLGVPMEAGRLSSLGSCTVAFEPTGGTPVASHLVAVGRTRYFFAPRAAWPVAPVAKEHIYESTPQ